MPDQELKIVAVEVPEESLKATGFSMAVISIDIPSSCGCLARSMATNGRAVTGMSRRTPRRSWSEAGHCRRFGL